MVAGMDTFVVADCVFCCFGIWFFFLILLKNHSRMSVSVLLSLSLGVVCMCCAACTCILFVCAVQTLFILVDQHPSVMMVGMGFFVVADCVSCCSRIWHNSMLCPICLTNDGGCFFFPRFMSLQCGHRFHSRCIDRWLALKGTCPCCRMAVQ